MTDTVFEVKNEHERLLLLDMRVMGLESLEDEYLLRYTKLTTFPSKNSWPSKP